MNLIIFRANWYRSGLVVETLMMASCTQLMFAQVMATSSMEFTLLTPLMMDKICFLSLSMIFQLILLCASSISLVATFTSMRLFWGAYWNGLREVLL